MLGLWRKLNIKIWSIFEDIFWILMLRLGLLEEKFRPVVTFIRFLGLPTFKNSMVICDTLSIFNWILRSMILYFGQFISNKQLKNRKISLCLKIGYNLLMMSHILSVGLSWKRYFSFRLATPLFIQRINIDIIDSEHVYKISQFPRSNLILFNFFL